MKFAEGNENAVVEPEKETTVLIIMKAIKTDFLMKTLSLTPTATAS